jgi:hypothetical protein
MLEYDSMHSAIEYAHKNLAVYSVNEWVNIIESARRKKPYSVELMMMFKDFHDDLKKLATKIICNRNKSTNEQLNLFNIRWPRFQKALPDRILFKADFDAEFDMLMNDEFGCLLVWGVIFSKCYIVWQ